MGGPLLMGGSIGEPAADLGGKREDSILGVEPPEVDGLDASSSGMLRPNWLIGPDIVAVVMGIISTGCSKLAACCPTWLFLLPKLYALVLSLSSLALLLLFFPSKLPSEKDLVSCGRPLPDGSYRLATLGIGGNTGAVAVVLKLNPLLCLFPSPSLVPGLLKLKLSPLILYGDCDRNGEDVPGRSRSKFICSGLTSGGGTALDGEEAAEELLRSCRWARTLANMARHIRIPCRHCTTIPHAASIGQSVA